MDTLAIVRKIRDAESLADAGNHGEARRLLEPLVDDNALSEAQRKLVARKIELFDRQHERMTRMVSRRAAVTSSDESSAGTVIRNPDEGRSERPTDVAIEEEPRGLPTEVVPRAVNVDTEVLEDSARRSPSESDRAGAFPRVDTGDSRLPESVTDEDRIDPGEDDDTRTDAFERPPDGHDTPVPGGDTSVTVRDSIIVPPADPEVHEDDPTRRIKTGLIQPGAAEDALSDGELKTLAERLPDDDLRRVLALEVVDLREQLRAERARPEKASESRRLTRVGSRRSQREERPESGSFRIPASEVNTIVRTAAGTDQIEVHMPGRDDDEAELQVLRRDSVRGKKVEGPASDRVALAQDYIDARQLSKPGLLKPVATYLGVAVVLGVVAWAAHLGYRTLQGTEEPAIDITANGVGAFEVGTEFAQYDELNGVALNVEGELRARDCGWIIQHDDDGMISAITVPGPEHSAGAASRFARMRVIFEGNTLTLAEGASPQDVTRALGQPTPRFSEELFNTSTEYTLTYLSRQGDRTLEFCYVTARPEAPKWIRIRSGKAPGQAPDLSVYRDDE